MPQDRNTGAAASRRGLDLAPLIASHLGATMTRKGSNEGTLDGNRIVIKSARGRNDQVGVTYRMLEHLDYVYAAFEESIDVYHVFRMSAAAFWDRVRDSITGKGKVGLVRKASFAEAGEFVGAVELETNAT